jgi:hypothetical protein
MLFAVERRSDQRRLIVGRFDGGALLFQMPDGGLEP